MRRLFLALLFAFAIVTSCAAQAPPGTGGYTFQGQGNIAQVFSGLVNPQYGQVPFGTKLGGYSLLVPGGDLAPDVSLGSFKVRGAHWSTQTCTSDCSVTSTLVSCNASSGPVNLQLPGAGATGFFAAVQKIDQTNNACNVKTAGSDTINGLNLIPISTPFLPMFVDDAQSGAWFAGLLTLATGATGINGFPLLGNADFNNFSGINVGGLSFVQQPPPSNFAVTGTCSGTCATTYTYEITCLTAFGESNAATSTSTNAATLSASNNNALNWTFQPQCRSGYNIYGRVGGALGLLTTLPQNTITWTDDGTIINPANSYTFTWQSAAYAAVQVWDLQGAAASNPIDKFASASGTSTRPTVPTITTTQNHDLQVATYSWDKNAGTWFGPAGFTSTITIPASPIVNYGLGLAQRDRPTAGVIASTLSNTSVSGSWAATNIAIKPANTGVAITVGSTPTFTATAPYTSVTFGDPAGTNTGDLELVCVSFLQGTTIQLPTAPAAFQLISSVISATGKVQQNCYYNYPNVSALPPPPSSNSTGGLSQVTANGTYHENLLGLMQFTADSANLPAGTASPIMKSTSYPVEMTVQSCRATWTNLSGCSTFPTWALKDTTANVILCSSGTTSGTATDAAVTPANTDLPAGDVLAFLSTTPGVGCAAAGQTAMSMVLHQ